MMWLYERGDMMTDGWLIFITALLAAAPGMIVILYEECDAFYELVDRLREMLRLKDR